MRKAMLIVWIIAPAVLLAWHYGPGQRQLLLDRAATERERAQACGATGDWESAVQAMGAAIALAAKAEAMAAEARGDTLPHAPLSPLMAELTLEQARARVRNGDLLEGIAELQGLIEHPGTAASLTPVAERARHEMASACYLAAWMMRLEGAASDEWQVEAEMARQEFRLLAETGAPANGPALAEAAERNLEATIRLQRMDLSELQALPIPKNCNCQGKCKNLSQRCRNQRLGRNPDKKRKSRQDDIREELKKINSAGKGDRGAGEAW